MKPNLIIKHFILKVIQQPPKDLRSLEQLKREFSRDNKISFLKNPEIKKVYEKMLQQGEIEPNRRFEELLITKKIRTLSGVAVVAVLTKAFPCPGKCIYCPDEIDMPKSYLSNEPAVMRAITAEFDPFRQTQARIRALELNGHPTDKIELIVMGGTFSYLPKDYQLWFITECFRACNDYGKSAKAALREIDPQTVGTGLPNPYLHLSLQIQQKRNERARHRIVGLTLETRPDYIDEQEILNFRQLGCTRVELGVQSIFDEVLKKNQRGHSVNTTIQATQLLKDAGFKINYHLMPGLYGSTPEKDRQMFEQLFSNPDFQPDMVKIYPCVVTANSQLHKLWQEKKYQPLTNHQAAKLLAQIKNLIPPYVRITRLIRDIPEESILAGPNISNLRQLLQNQGVSCQCIRCREVREQYTPSQEIVLDRIDYPASEGQEIFLQFVSPDRTKLYALLRLRIPQINHNPAAKNYIPTEKIAFPVLKNAAIIREVHTYGKLIALQSQNQNSPQHIGLGRQLLQLAEKIAREEFDRKKIAVISGIGVRDYYRKNGYRLKDTYMLKIL